MSDEPRTIGWQKNHPEQRKANLKASFAAAQAIELAALTELEAKLTVAMLELLPAAVAAASRKKPDVRLLRLISRHVSVTARKLQSAQAVKR